MHASARSITGWRGHLWLALLVAATIAFTAVFACAAPFAALGAMAALTLSRRDALLLTGEVWLVNQLVGFLLVGYPWTVNSAAWGLGIGVAAVLATLAARWTTRRLAAVSGTLQAVASSRSTRSRSVPARSCWAGPRTSRHRSSPRCWESTPRPSPVSWG